MKFYKIDLATYFRLMSDARHEALCKIEPYRSWKLRDCVFDKPAEAEATSLKDAGLAG